MITIFYQGIEYWTRHPETGVKVNLGYNPKIADAKARAYFGGNIEVLFQEIP